MAKIRIDIDALKRSSSELSGKIAELNELNSRYEALINEISSTWEGDSSAAYTAKMREYRDKAVKTASLLTEYKRYVDKAIETFNDVDRRSASRINGSF